MIFRAQERSDDLEDALDMCVDSLIRQIRKNKTRIEKKLRDVSFDDVLAEDFDEEEIEVVRSKTVVLKPEDITFTTTNDKPLEDVIIEKIEIKTY